MSENKKYYGTASTEPATPKDISNQETNTAPANQQDGYHDTVDEQNKGTEALHSNTEVTAPYADLKAVTEVPDAPYLIKHNTQAPTPFVFAIPHSGRYYPASLIEQTCLAPHTLRISEDAWVDKLFADTPQFGGAQIIATYGRSYLDLNRAANELNPAMFSPALNTEGLKETHRVRAGLGVIPELVAPGMKIYDGPLPAREAESRIESVYYGYHNKLKSMISRRKATFENVVLIDCHSMPSNSDSDPKKSDNNIHGPDRKGAAARLISGLARKRSRSHDADIVLGDLWGASCDSMLTATVERLLIAEGFKVIRNIPYAGGFATQHYGRPQKGVHALQIEINRAIYMDEETLEPLPGFTDIQRRLSRFAANLMLDYSKTMPLAAE